MEGKGEGDTNCNWRTRNNTQRISKGLKDLEISGQIGQNTETGPEDLLRHTVAQTPLKKPSAHAGVKNS